MLEEAEHGPWSATPDDVARLTRPQREDRVKYLIISAHRLLASMIQHEITDQKRTLSAVAILYSGGNDSTTLAHLFRSVATHAVHANTGIGIPETRQFVRDTCASWGLPLIEEHPPTSYRELVLDRGFPGPAHHWKMYQRLKERCIEQARKKLVPNPYRQRMIYLAGRRRSESERRSDLTFTDRRGSAVFVSPMLLWTKLDLNTYRLMMGDVPHNEVTDRLHMSGECLCGAFAHPNELEEIGLHYPGTRREIEELEAEVLETGKFPEWQCRWGWGADKDKILKALRTGMTPEQVGRMFRRSKVGFACSTCDSR